MLRSETEDFKKLSFFQIISKNYFWFNSKLFVFTISSDKNITNVTYSFSVELFFFHSDTCRDAQFIA